ncbi:MAG TPA: SDR family oxidoreductase [Longimicrobium sp.]|nr:SDR family oxidoreductase [Longimicrobium sp.]
MTGNGEFEGRVAVVTGGGRGIGRAICMGLSERGARVVVADIRGEKAREAAAALPAGGIGVEADVASEESVRSLFDAAEREYGRVDFLVNNAAIMLDVPVAFKPFWETPLEEWTRMMAVNVGGVFLCCKHAKPLMEKEGGRVINISSDAIWKGYESQLHYFASKGAVAVMTRNLARELGPFNINVNAIAPGYTLSDAVLDSPDMQGVRHLVMNSCCIKRDQHPEDVAGAAVFLCSGAAACITGQSIVVNCGAIMP